MYKTITDFIKHTYNTPSPINLHEPRFIGNEKKYLAECIDSTFVSYVGSFVTAFEDSLKAYTGAKFAVAMTNGTLALHLALRVCGVLPKDEVITQALTFVATANAISYIGAHPIFLDSDLDTLGLSPEKLLAFLKNETQKKEDGFSYNKKTGRRISACVPVHVFGHPARIADIVRICDDYNLVVVEDAAESLGSFYQSQHTGTFGLASVLSFNGNKTITTGGGGMLLTNDETIATSAKHLSTTAKIPHPWAFEHDEIGYNYRMPNLNAALGCAQMETLDLFLTKKREQAERYATFFAQIGVDFIVEPKDSRSNYWLNAIMLKDRTERDAFLAYSHSQGVMTRPVWRLMSQLPMYKDAPCGDLEHAEHLEARLVNLPSSVRV